MKKWLILGIIFIIGVLIGFMVVVFNGESGKKKIGNFCEKLEIDINKLLDDINYCTEDSDCEYESRYYCPFGCYQLFNKNVDLSLIDEKVLDFRNENCNLCEYECFAPPIYEEIKCVNNKCINIMRVLQEQEFQTH